LEIARVTTNALDAPALAQVDHWCTTNRIDCLYYLADGTLPTAASAAESGGFHLVDVRVTLTRGAGGRGGAAPSDHRGAKAAPPLPRAPREVPTSKPGEPTIRQARAADLDRLRAIASTSHRDSRFYRDGRFPEARCDALYEAWIAKSCASETGVVLVADVGGAA